MAKKYYVLIALMLGFLFAFSNTGAAKAATETKTFYSIADAWIDEGDSYATHPSGDLVVSYSASTYRTDILVKFDVSSIPAGATVNTAYLKLYTQACSGLASPTLNTYRLISVWNESTANWFINLRTTGAGMGSSNATTCAIGYWSTLDAKDITQAWASGSSNYGIRISSSETSTFSRTFLSRDNETVKPKLIVEYSYTPAAPAAPAGSTGTTSTGSSSSSSTSSNGATSTSGDGTISDGSSAATTNADGATTGDSVATQTDKSVSDQPLSVFETIKHPSQLFFGKLPWWKVGLIILVPLVIIAGIITIIVVLTMRNKKKVTKIAPPGPTTGAPTTPEAPKQVDSPEPPKTN